MTGSRADEEEMLRIVKERVFGLATHSLYKAKFESDKEHNPANITVSDIKYPCLKPAFYSRLYPDVGWGLDSVIRVVSGTAGHEAMKMTSMHEKVFVWNKEIPIGGKIDEYDSALKFKDKPLCIIIDKKFTGHMPKQARDHDMTQIQMYGEILYANGLKVDAGALVYVCYEGELEVFPFLVRPPNPTMQEIMTVRYFELRNAIDTKTPPPMRATWRCKPPYCPANLWCLGRDFEP